ncbi:PAS domain S-box protein [Metabacillus sp. GX 13764]|uniref:PAS domain S-box protein n=1 Tax=Metabacillus kandeliae TaxID=2900151 RepID=UPI001E412735|nr:PAS domain S-box protein [Metabacillus kandeliae]MCD7035444.1 PAS domain S-box protein [Metabacillus kandeliae]
MNQKLVKSQAAAEKADLYAVVSSSGKILFISSNSKQHFGYEQGELVGKYIKEMIHPEDSFLVESYFYNDHHLYPCTFRFQKKTYDYVWVETSADFIENRLVSEEREVVIKLKLCSNVPYWPSFLALSKDRYTEKKQESPLKEEALSMLETLPSPVFIAINGQFQYVNQSMVSLLGAASPEELAGRSVFDFILEEYHDITRTCISRLHNNSFVGLVEQTWKRLDGKLVEAEVKSASTVYNGQKAELIVVIDISSRKKFQKILQKSRERYQKLIQNSIDTIAVIHQYNWVFMNESGVNLFHANDYPELLGKSIFYFMMEEDQQQTKCVLDRILSGKSEVEEIKQSWKTFAGTVIYTEAVCIPTTFFGEPAVQMILRDISDRKTTEELMLRSEKLSVAGQLAAGIAHEIRNPLTAIKGFLQLMQPPKETNPYYSIVFSELNRIELILSELLLLAKPQESVFSRTSIKTLIQDVVTLLETQANLRSISILQNHEASGLQINCDQNQLKQVFINLIKNAIDAMPEGGQILISTNADREKLTIQVRDKGKGIPPEVLKRMGEPFFTTKEKGTGLGLMITYNIIENHNGSIQAESKPGEGTVFTIALPL